MTEKAVDLGQIRGDWGFSASVKNRSWSDNRMVHHPVFEDACSLDGHLVYNFGTLDAGTYFFRLDGQ